MSTEEKKRKIFLCCFCGIRIHSTRFNLDQHEKLHGSQITKIKCAAKQCDSTLANKSIYWRHWNDKHRELTMPDFIIYVDVPAGRSRRTGLAKKIKREGEGRAGRATKMMMNKQAAQEKHSKNEAPNDLNFDIQNAIEDCLLQDPYYGCLNYSSV